MKFVRDVGRNIAQTHATQLMTTVLVLTAEEKGCRTVDIGQLIAPARFSRRNSSTLWNEITMLSIHTFSLKMLLIHGTPMTS
jgi:hypothetical protein